MSTEEIIFIASYAVFGAVMRILWAVWKAEESVLNIRLSGKRLVFEFLVSFLFGIFGGQLVTDLGLFKVGINLATIVSSLIGANVVDVIAKKFGFTKKMEAIVSDQQITSGLNFREANAMEFVKINRTITNMLYQKINSTTHDIAKHELDFLVQCRKLRRMGTRNLTYYILV